MADRRMISGEIWRDEVVSSLNFLGRLLWVGLIVTCADDQGRLINNPKLIRTDVFPLDDIPVAQIQSVIQELEQSGSIIAYETEGKSLIQLANWWEYQSPSWASPSRYPAPDGWVDRVKIHHGASVFSRNWTHPGGFKQELPTGIPTGIPTDEPNDITKRIEEKEVKSKSKSKSRGEEELPARAAQSGNGSKPIPNPAATAAAMAQFGNIPDEAYGERIYCQATGFTTIPPSIRETAERTILSLRSRYPNSDDLVKHLKTIYARWCATRGKNGKPYSRLGSGWLEWALDDPSKPLPVPAGKTKSGLITYTDEQIAQMRKDLE